MVGTSYEWKGETKTVKDTTLGLAQAYLALLNPEHIEQRLWMIEQSGKQISQFRDMTGYNAFRFDMQTTSPRTDGKYYCIQMQSNYQSKSRSVSGRPKSYSHCDVQIHEDAAPSRDVFLDACWSSAARCNEPQKPGTAKRKTMTVVIYANNTWRNLETDEGNYERTA